MAPIAGNVSVKPLNEPLEALTDLFRLTNSCIVKY